jgi:hypothetical protein
VKMNSAGRRARWWPLIDRRPGAQLGATGEAGVSSVRVGGQPSPAVVGRRRPPTRRQRARRQARSRRWGRPSLLCGGSRRGPASVLRRPGPGAWPAGCRRPPAGGGVAEGWAAAFVRRPGDGTGVCKMQSRVGEVAQREAGPGSPAGPVQPEAAAICTLGWRPRRGRGRGRAESRAGWPPVCHGGWPLSKEEGAHGGRRRGGLVSSGGGRRERAQARVRCAAGCCLGGDV